MFSLNVPDENDKPIRFFGEDSGETQMAVVERECLHGLEGEEFEPACVYLLLDRHNANGKWGLYIGQAKHAKSRLQNHQREKPNWYRALLILHPGRLEPNVMTSLWLERHLYEKLRGRPGIQLHNASVPQGNNELTAYQQQRLKSFTPTVMQALRLLGHDPDTRPVVNSAVSPGAETTKQAKPAKIEEPTKPSSGEQAMQPKIGNDNKKLTSIPEKPKTKPVKPKKPAKKRKIKRYNVKLSQIMREGLLHEDTRLISTVSKYPAEAHLGLGGIVIYNGIKHDTPSAAGRSVTGRACSGWDFWAVIAADSPTDSQATLKEIRDIYIKRRDEGTLTT